jgi:hypothetical protein
MNVDFKISNRHFSILSNKRIKVYEIQGTYIIENNNSIIAPTGPNDYYTIIWKYNTYIVSSDIMARSSSLI